MNPLELVGRSWRYHKVGYSPEAIDRLLCDLYIESHVAMPDQIVLDIWPSLLLTMHRQTKTHP